ncbi:type VII secretion protein EssB [Neobacillus sp. LXY-1]|uniref:type VII secretion protein EssB n=1 Tax=Neobacillus sp. LXY-1 TaxID=3379133 RepID=UPI003EE0F4EF
MNEKKIEMESLHLHFLINTDKWQLQLPKSQTRVKDIRQMALINDDSRMFVPAMVEEEDDYFIFTYSVNPQSKTWEDIRKLDRKDKLRLLCNLAGFKNCLSTRMTFFLHPDNLIVDDNLSPSLVYRGIRDLIPPYLFDEKKFILQYKCLIIAMFSKKYSFDELYAGSLKQAKDTEFERQVSEMEDVDSLIQFLHEKYIEEKKAAEKNLQIVPKKQFRLFKRLAFTMIAISVLLAVPLVYLGFVKIPFQGHLLEAHRHFLAMDYGGVINDLDGQTPEKLPDTSKYVLAYSYIESEPLADRQKKAILKNISIKSDPNYLLYWIYNGRGDFDRTIDLAKYIDDPQLIMYGLIKQIEKAKNDPNLSGSEREKKVSHYQEQYQTYAEKYGLDLSLNEENTEPAAVQETNHAEDTQDNVKTDNQEKTNPSPGAKEEKTSPESSETKKASENKK